jgi:predicted amidophosphoribosyltransferase
MCKQIMPSHDQLSVTHIALIDDVITTGATTKTLAYLLREHGATHIQAWSIARST